MNIWSCFFKVISSYVLVLTTFLYNSCTWWILLLSIAQKTDIAVSILLRKLILSILLTIVLLSFFLLPIFLLIWMFCSWIFLLRDKINFLSFFFSWKFLMNHVSHNTIYLWLAVRYGNEIVIGNIVAMNFKLYPLALIMSPISNCSSPVILWPESSLV